MIFLSDLEEIGRGYFKNVYQHPEYPDRVIKVNRPERVSADGCFVEHSSWKRHYMQGVYRQFRREVLQYLQLFKNNYGSQGVVFPVETFYGFVQTDAGLGLVAEKIVGPSGQGETLSKLGDNGGLEEKHLIALRKFFDDCSNMHVAFGDVNADGILYTESRNGYPEFVLVDGIGDKLFIPLRAIFKKNNDWYINKIEGRIKSKYSINF